MKYVAADNDEIGELKRMIPSMQRTIADQNARLAEQSARIASLEKRQLAEKLGPAEKPAAGGPSLKVLGATVAAGEVPAAALPKGRSAVPDKDNFVDNPQAMPRVNNAPLDPKLKGFIRLPGTDTLFKIGGSAPLDVINDFANPGNPNLFMPSTIPVPGGEGANAGQRSMMHAKGTRLSRELRRPAGDDGSLRAYREFDFFDDFSSSAMKFRPRHFYGQAWNVLPGQTFSAFMDGDAFPDTVDDQGPNGVVNRRQPQIRCTLPLRDDETNFSLFASLERADRKVDTSRESFPVKSSTVTHVPNDIVGFLWEGGAGHLQAASLFREPSSESDSGVRGNVFGRGVSLSGERSVGRKDTFAAQTTRGRGIARYVNDLRGEDLDAAMDHGSLEAIPVFATMAGYTHDWCEHWRSTLAGGYVRVDSPASLGPRAIDNTLYGSTNFMWHPTPAFRMRMEYPSGRKETIDASERDAQRLNVVVRYDLVR